MMSDLISKNGDFTNIDLASGAMEKKKNKSRDKEITIDGWNNTLFNI